LRWFQKPDVRPRKEIDTDWFCLLRRLSPRWSLPCGRVQCWLKQGEDAAGDSVANPLGIGLGVRYITDAFGVKFRMVATLGGDDKATKLLVDVLPFFSLGDNLKAYVSLGLGINAPDEGDAVTGWHLNPYIQVGEEWGPKFLAGIKLWSDGQEQANGDPAIVRWAVPIALIVSF